MLFLTLVKSALKSLASNKLRSFLAMLGIIIGVGAVISMLAIAAGAQRDIMDRLSAIGTNLLSIRPSFNRSRGGTGGARENLTLEDALAVLDEVPAVENVSPSFDSRLQLKYYGENTKCEVTGVAVTYLKIRNFEVEHGRFFKESEVDRMARVVVLGPETAENLKIEKTNIGEDIKIKGINFKLLGILKEKGGGGRFNPDDQAIVPYTTAMKILFGLDHIESIDLQAANDADMTKIEEDIAAVLRKRHGITDSEEDDFRIFNQAELIETASDFSRTFTFLLGSIAAISLLVGGIGIMNIMLVTVTERTREIGVRKAIGAKDRDILSQFLLESLIMSGAGGIIGVAAGIAASRIIGNASEFVTLVEPSSVLLALSFSMAVGVFFGYYPAHRAAGLDPIECLYYE